MKAAQRRGRRHARGLLVDAPFRSHDFDLLEIWVASYALVYKADFFLLYSGYELTCYRFDNMTM